MHKDEFKEGLLVRPAGSKQFMVLSGSPGNWLCSWIAAGQRRTVRYMPEDLQPVHFSTEASETRHGEAIPW
jgi:hypothetical protein